MLAISVPLALLLAGGLTSNCPAGKADGSFSEADRAVKSPRRISSGESAFPIEALAPGARAVVDGCALVDEHGAVRDLTVTTTGLDPRIVAAFVALQRGAKYEPGSREGQPVRVWLSVRSHFARDPAAPPGH